jgi:hypothetical protein
MQGPHAVLRPQGDSYRGVDMLPTEISISSILEEKYPTRRKAFDAVKRTLKRRQHFVTVHGPKIYLCGNNLKLTTIAPLRAHG